MHGQFLQVHLAGVETLRSEKDLLALFAARQNRMLGQLKQKMAAASVSGSQAKEVRQQSCCRARFCSQHPYCLCLQQVSQAYSTCRNNLSCG